MKNVNWILIFFGLFNQCVVSYSQEPLKITKINSEIKFDGVVDESVWETIETLPFIMHTPTFGNQPTEKTELKLCYDNNYLYAGARLYDSNPAGMLISSKKRDESTVANEELVLILDTFNDNENAVGFGTTPSGLRNDFTIYKDAMVPTKEGPFNPSWNTFWDVKTTRNDLGWFVEMRIPFSSIRFKEENGKIVMGFSCIRKIAHKNEVDIYPSIPPNWGRYSAYRPSKSQEIYFEGLVAKKPFYIAPYIIGGFEYDNKLNETSTGYKLDRDPVHNAGLDLKYGLTNNLTVDLTVNTDFAQVEADDEQINLTRFSLFYPEKRTFFQERSSVFTYDFERGSSLFYSRNIGLTEDGERVPIYGGARITGMAGKWDVGFLDMQTRSFETEDTTLSSLTSENFGILRLRRQVINESSYVGGILTSRIGTDGHYNNAYGIDGIFKFFENDYLNIKLAQVMDNGSPNKVLSMDPTRLHIGWNRFNDKGLGYDLTYSRSGKDFDPGIGFMTRSDYSFYSASAGYGWLPGESSPLQSYKVGFMSMTYTDNRNNDLQSLDARAYFDFRFKSDYNGRIFFQHQIENVTDTFTFSNTAYVPSGIYRFYQLESHINSPQSNSFVLGTDFFAGSFYDGSRFTFGLEPSWHVGSLLQLSLKYDHNFLKFSSRNQKFSGGTAGFKALFMFTTSLSISTFIQYNTSENSVLSNFRFRYNPREGNDFFIVFNEGRSTYRNIEDPRLPLFNSRSLLLKYTYTFTI